MLMKTEKQLEISCSSRIFNATVVASAISAAFDLGLFDEMRAEGKISIRRFCERNDLHCNTVRAILIALQTEKIVKFDSEKDVASTDELFQQVFFDKGYFAWLVGGYGAMLQNLSAIAKNENRKGDFSGRCGQRIASAGRDYGAHFVDRSFKAFLEEANYKAVADLGCGSAERLIQIGTANRNLQGIGIEVNSGAVSLARSSIAKAGLQDRIQVVAGDLRELSPSHDWEDVELVFSFFMGHDLWPRQQCLLALQNVRKMFPNAHRFLLCDTYRSQSLEKADVPIFTLGFEFTHMVMGDYVPTLNEWMELFEETEWECDACHSIGIPYSCIFDLRVK
ncbi:MAG: methyltransferase domain-containing protein [Rubripirellula sp.]